MKNENLSTAMRDLNFNERLELLEAEASLQKLDLSVEEFQEYTMSTSFQANDLVKKERKKRVSDPYIAMTDQEKLLDKIKRTESKVERSININEMEKWVNELVNLNSKYISKYVNVC